MPDDADIKKLQEELKKLQEENKDLKSTKGQAELDKAIAEAQRAAVIARMPPSDVKPLEGKVTVDAAAVTEIQRLAHEAMSEAATKMATDIVGANVKTVVIHDGAEVAALAHFKTVEAQLRLLSKGYEAAYGAGAGGNGPQAAAAAVPFMFGPAVAGAAVKSVIDLLSLFRTNVEIKSAVITFEDASVVALIAERLRKKDCELKVFYPALIPLGSLDGPAADASEMLMSIQALAETRQKAGAEVASFEAQTDDQKKAVPEAGARAASLKALNTLYDQLLSGIAQIVDATQSSSLSLLLRGESLSRRMSAENGTLLFVKAVGGGESMVRQSLLRGSKLFYRGTAILTYLLFDNSGELLRSNVLAESTAFEKFDI